MGFDTSTDKLIESVILAEEEEKLEYTLSTLAGNEYIPQAALAIEMFGITADEIAKMDKDTGQTLSRMKTGLWRSLVSTRSVNHVFIDAVTTQKIKNVVNSPEAKKAAMANIMGGMGIGAPPKVEQ